MKGYFDSKITEALTLAVGEEYDVAYTYDDAGRIIKEEVTGSVVRVVDYAYDASDNIVTETITLGDKTITKTYTYDAQNNISNVAVRVS